VTFGDRAAGSERSSYDKALHSQAKFIRTSPSVSSAQNFRSEDFVVSNPDGPFKASCMNRSPVLLPHGGVAR
jgi:hypothetical protein